MTSGHRSADQQGRTVRIIIEPAGQRDYRISFEGSSGRVDCERVVSHDAIAGARLRATKFLTTAREKVTGADLGTLTDWSVADELFQSVSRNGVGLLLKLLGPNASRIDDVMSLLEYEMRASYLGGDMGQAVTAELWCSEATYFPIELLPIGRRANPIVDGESMDRAFRSIVGYTAITRTFLSQRVSDTWVRSRRSGLSGLFYYDASVAHYGREMRDIVATSGAAIEGPYPRPDESRDKFGRSLAKELLGHDDRAASFAHFSCHCDTEDDDSSNHTLSFRAYGGERLELSLSDLEDEIGYALLHPPPIRGDPVALIFANACGTSRVDRHGPSSLARLFADAVGVRAFIGPLVNVPDNTATSFARTFYRCLGSARRLGGTTDPVGSVLALARQQFLRDTKNPMGLAYVLYGDPDLTLPAQAAGGGET